MTLQFVSLAAHIANIGGSTAMHMQMVEPSAMVLVLIGLAGVVVGRFLLGRNPD
ncbi:hypothetical protein NCF85_00750 [Qipengyuania citrea]|jgi:hypothetical protein|uniref:PEP-CTERM sorting domain-containing protein n=1 Tax=Qipengyuania citrea TaxID=225971 RepID=A0ABY4U622_9SPHN|nr:MULTISPECIES: hypothetical protein [Qipengyuania]MDB2694882.1 hypothetical protein [Erythrobacter sp.]MEC7888866.1 hypothetical protein [Pseudomonadota bacterium]QPL39733.1 hypothetical protein IT881_00165 [Erythrobacter sp. A30-3]MBY8334192.1 hypothetical protein [Qipengyuania pacifica]USA61545.1 hypothetical protein NCF85_00750 [Qipengyuania citrea]|tara:strand:+ start:392 stop:553 length:162 start_codon:yes stop_codon:yes gene_type:complete